MKLSLAWSKYLTDEEVEILLSNYKNLSALDLRGCPITNISVDSIIKHLKLNLQELSLSYTNVKCQKLLELKSMSHLKVFNCLHLKSEEIDLLKQEIPQLTINSSIKVAAMLSFEPEDGFWDIEAKQIKIGGYSSGHCSNSAAVKAVSQVIL